MIGISVISDYQGCVSKNLEVIIQTDIKTAHTTHRQRVCL